MITIMLFSKLKQIWVLYKALKAKGKLPVTTKWLVWGAVAYLLLPFDLIVDFLPGLGQIDDLLVIGSLLWTAWAKLRGAASKDPSIERKVIEGKMK